MDHVGLDLTGAQPTRQPEAIAAGFIGDGDPLDRAPSLNGFIPPTMQKLQPPMRSTATWTTRRPPWRRPFISALNSPSNRSRAQTLFRSCSKACARRGCRRSECAACGQVGDDPRRVDHRRVRAIPSLARPPSRSEMSAQRRLRSLLARLSCPKFAARRYLFAPSAWSAGMLGVVSGH
jgi:hypothetical protein